MYGALITPLLVFKFSFFPFIAGKAISFRLIVELALLFFIVHVLFELGRGGASAHAMLQYLKEKLKHPIVIAASLFALMMLLTALVGVNPTESVWSNFERGDGAFQVIHYALFFILAVLLFPDGKSVRRLLGFNILVSIPMSAYALGQLIASDPQSFFLAACGGGDFCRVSGTLGNPSYLAAYLLFSLVSIVYLLFVHRKYLERFVGLFLTIPGVCGIIMILTQYSSDKIFNEYLNSLLWKFSLWYLVVAGVLYGISLLSKNKHIFQQIVLLIIGLFEIYILLKTGTRGALLALLVGLFVILVINIMTTTNRQLKQWLLGALGIVVIVPSLFFATRNATLWKHIPIFNRLIDFTSAVTDIQPRIWTWGSALSGVLEHPIAGYGAENFPYAFDTYYNPGHYGIESFFDRTHNIFLEYLITGGLLVFIPWIAIFVIYYMRLKKRPKDFWYSILFAMPIMYLIQGSFLFDTLPIYIAFFVFLTFFISTEQERTLPGIDQRYQLFMVPICTSVLLAGFIGVNLYFTGYLPMRKNYYLVRALLLQSHFTTDINNNAPQLSVTPQQVINAFEQAYSSPSPIGQEETIGMFQKFVVFVLDVLGQNPKATSDGQVTAETRVLVQKTNGWYDKNLALFPGIKEIYLNGGINLRFGLAFNQPDLKQRGKDEYQKALELSPTRLEVIRVMIEVAKIEKDNDAYTLLISKAKYLRPDIEWK